MARLPHSAVVLRFRLGAGLVKARQRFDNTSRAILERVTIQYADGAYDQVRKDVEKFLENDVRAELVHLAMLFRRHIIGAAGTRTSPSGNLDTVTKGEGAPSQSISSGLPAWKARNREYLRQKRSATGNVKWFDNRNWRHRPTRNSSRKGGPPADVGLLFETMRADVWERMFGPISVKFFRSRALTAGDSQFSLGNSKKLKIQIGSIQVRALGNIEPGMLPGYRNGNVMASAGGNPALIRLISNYDRRIGYRLGTMNNGVYRPTLEPFLGFFLTKALPFAVSRRLSSGGFKSIVIR